MLGVPMLVDLRTGELRGDGVLCVTLTIKHMQGSYRDERARQSLAQDLIVHRVQAFQLVGEDQNVNSRTMSSGQGRQNVVSCQEFLDISPVAMPLREPPYRKGMPKRVKGRPSLTRCGANSRTPQQPTKHQVLRTLKCGLFYPLTTDLIFGVSATACASFSSP